MVSTIEDRTGLGYEDGAHAVILEREGDKMRPGKTRAVLGSAVVIAMLSACGGSTHQSGVTSRGARSPRLPLNGSGEELFDGKRGGTLTVYDHTDFPNLDPGEAYDDISYQVIYATQRPLFSYRPNQSSVPSPDLASGPAAVSPDGRTVTVHIRHGVHFSPPVDREVTSADVAYAIERGASPNVSNPYFAAYFSDIVGASKATGGPIAGIKTPNRYTIVFHLTGPYGGFFANALSLPLTAPVPKEFAAPLDAQRPTTYGLKYLVATGPYMLKADVHGKISGIGYQPGKSATLVRNPNWVPATDNRPAYLNQIDINIGGDPNVIGRQVLVGSDSVQNDTPAGSAIKLAYQHYFKQLVTVPGTGVFYVALNNRKGPFSNANVRRALWAALDREEIIQVAGGPLVYQLGTHFLYPGTDGYQLAGGAAGPRVDYNMFPTGNTALAGKYLTAAGFPSGRYTGDQKVQVVGVTGNPGDEIAQIVNQTLKNLGFNTNLTLLDFSALGKYCGTPAQEIDVCPASGWVRDFADPQTVLEPTFAGYNITSTNNSNVGQVNDPRINAAMRAAEKLVGVNARAKAWARIDRMLVGIAAAVPYAFSKSPLIESRDVRGVSDVWNGSWDYSYSSLK